MAHVGKISFWAAVLMSINIIVGAGIFTVPQKMTLIAGSLSFLSWPLVGLLMFPVIWSIAQASRIFPGEGGFYNYCSQGINKTAGFIAQWCYVLGYMGTAATITTALREGFVDRLGFSFAGQHPYLFNALVIIFFSFLNLLSIEMISRLQSGITLIKMLPLFFVIAVFVFYWNSSLTYNVSSLGNLGLTLPGAIFAYWGFEACCSLGHLLKGGPQQVGKIILTAFGLAALIYMFFHLGLIHIMGVDALTTQGVLAFPQFMGLSTTATSIIAVLIIGSIFLSFSNTIFGVSLTNITNIFMFAEQKLILGGKFLTRTNRLQRPTAAALVHGIALWILLFFITSRSILTALTDIGVCSAFVLTLVALLLTYIKRRNYFQIFVTILGFISCGILIYYCWIDISPEPMARLIYIMPLLVGAIAGFVLYKLQQMKKGKKLPFMWGS